MKELLRSKRGTPLRKNGSRKLNIVMRLPRTMLKDYDYVHIINGIWFITNITYNEDLIVQPHDYFMIINNRETDLEIHYTEDVSNMEIIYDPYKYEDSEKVNFKAEEFIDKYDLPSGYTDTLPKWYSFKFTYPDHNLIFIRPEMGISVQTHNQRNETWEILDGKPIILNDRNVYYFVEKGTKFEIPIHTYHSAINPNKDKFVLIKETWNGDFDEEDITRVYNPNNYQ